MTYDPPRQYAKPIEELAEAIDVSGQLWLAQFVAANPTLAASAGWSDVPSDVFAQACLAVMRKHGWISDLGMSAIKAEEAAENEHVAADVSANPRKSNKKQEG